MCQFRVELLVLGFLMSNLNPAHVDPLMLSHTLLNLNFKNEVVYFVAIE